MCIHNKKYWRDHGNGLNRMRLGHRPLNPSCPSCCLFPSHIYASLPLPDQMQASLLGNQDLWGLSCDCVLRFVILRLFSFLMRLEVLFPVSPELAHSSPTPNTLEIALGCFRTKTPVLGTLPLSFCKDSTVQSCFKLSLVAIKTSRQACLHLQNGLENPGQTQIRGNLAVGGCGACLPFLSCL